MNKEIEIIIIKFLTNCSTEEDLNKLSNWLKIKNNVHFFDNYIETNYALDMNFNKFDSKNIKQTLAKKIKQDRSVFYKLKINKVMKYAAVVVMIFGLGYFFRQGGFNTSIEIEPVVVNDRVVPGTDKAILTLEDGSQIVLEKGKSLQTQNANSNGDEIIYKANQSSIKEVVYNYLTIPRGGQFFIKLSDGTQVWLNSESQLKYPINFKEGEVRNVELVYGEAYFDVSPSIDHKGSKFKVFNQSQEVEVLGTEFNIKAYRDESNIYTTLVEGEIEVNTPLVKQLLIPNQQANVDTVNSKLSVADVDVKTVISWRKGVFDFKNKSLKEIMKVISRWYDIDVVFENKELENIMFDGVLGKDQNLDEILLTIRTLSIIKDYEINKRIITLK